MSTNADALEKGSDAFAQGDMDSVRSIWTDDTEWQGPDLDSLPDAGRFTGPDAIIEMFGRLPEYWDGLKVTPDEFLEDGDTVVVLGHNEGRGKSTGDEWKVPFVHAWRIRDGKAERVQLLYDTGVTARALGV